MTENEAFIRDAGKLTGPEKHLFRMAVLAMTMEPGDPEYHPDPAPISRISAVDYMLKHDIRPSTARRHLEEHGERLMRRYVDLSFTGNTGGLRWIGAIDFDGEAGAEQIKIYWVAQLVDGLMHLQHQYQFEERQRLQAPA